MEWWLCDARDSVAISVGRGSCRTRLRLIGAFAIIRGVEGNDMPVAMMMNEVQNYPDLWTEIDDNIRQCI